MKASMLFLRSEAHLIILAEIEFLIDRFSHPPWAGWNGAPPHTQSRLPTLQEIKSQILNIHFLLVQINILIFIILSLMKKIILIT